MTRHLGLDLGGTNVKAVVLDDSEVVARATSPTDAQHGPEGVVERLAEVARWAIERHGPVQTIGLGIPGLFDPADGRVLLFPNLPGPWAGYPLRARLEQELGAVSK